MALAEYRKRTKDMSGRMIKIVLAGALLLPPFIVGCTSAYWVDRGRDAADIVTLTAGVSLGAKVRVSILHAGLYSGMDLIGVRGGTFFSSGGGLGLMEGDITVLTDDRFTPVFLNGNLRGKTYRSCGAILPISILIDDHRYLWGKDYTNLDDIMSRSTGTFHPYYTQIEVAFGLGVGLRIGLNPGEFLDFVLGWFDVDIFDDDVGLADAGESSGEPATAE